MSPRVTSLLTLTVTLATGIGGAIGAQALGAPELADAVLAFAGGLGLGLLAPQLRVSA